MIEIHKLKPETADLLWTVEDRRLDSERVVVRPKPGGFDIDYKALPGALWRVGNISQEAPFNAETWLTDPEKGVYLAWLDDTVAGQVLVETWEHRLARIRDIRVALSLRRRGVGESLLSMAEDWTRAMNLHGIVAETQDVNAGACQFLIKCGYQLGGIDALRYVARSQQTMMAVGLRESALFFYRFLRER